MIIKIAWRNVWRSPLRTSVVIAALASGLFAGCFVGAFYNGFTKEKVNSVIALEMSHLQVHEQDFREERRSKFKIENGAALADSLRGIEGVVGVSQRAIFEGSMLSSSRYTGAIRLVGIDPDQEQMVTNLHTFLDTGQILSAESGKLVWVSQKIAEKYKVKLRSKMKITLMLPDGETGQMSLRVGGVFNTKNGPYDERSIFISRDHLISELGYPDLTHEIAVLMEDLADEEVLAKSLDESYPGLEILPWLDLAPGMRMMMDMMGTMQLIIVGIILLALMFGIVNTMLMAVLERVREFGVLMAVGMSKKSIFKMVVFETMMLSLVGTPVGFLAAYSLISWFSTNGMDLGALGEFYEEMGFASKIYPELPAETYIQITIMVVVMAAFASLIPAIKALRLKPVEAIRKT